MMETKTIGAKLQGDLTTFMADNREDMENDPVLLHSLNTIYAGLANVQKIDDLYFRDIMENMKIIEGYTKAAGVWVPDKDLYKKVFYKMCHLYSDLINDLWDAL